ncbi:MAG: hypothetical protein GKR94_13795 [Gammaproteobacteria bacterium]|nr:hypothetical protein [Gammaproteobacteria bacterium]
MADVTEVDAQDPAKKNSPIMVDVESESTVVLDAATRFCYWNGGEFPEGAEVTNNGNSYECSYGNWVKI